MCLPIAGVLIGLGVAGLGAQVASTAIGISERNKAARMNADIAERNARNAELQAQSIEKAGHTEESQYRKQLSQLLGRQHAVYAASGVAVGSGSAADVDISTRESAEAEIGILREASALEAWGVRKQRESALLQAKYLRSSIKSPVFPVIGSLLTGGSQLAVGIYGATRS